MTALRTRAERYRPLSLGWIMPRPPEAVKGKAGALRALDRSGPPQKTSWISEKGGLGQRAAQLQS
jgi:hypothetical protein